jgi:hypothetical protein
LPSTSSYRIGSDPAAWILDVPHYGGIVGRNVNPGIDVALYGNQGHLEFDFVLQPHADPARSGLPEPNSASTPPATCSRPASSFTAPPSTNRLPDAKSTPE